MAWGCLGHQLVLVGQVQNGALDLAFEHANGAVFRAGHIAAVAELDAFAFGDDVANRLGAGAACVEGEWLTIEVFPCLVFAVNDREEHQACALEQDAHGRLGLLDDGVGCAHAQVSLSVDDGLNRQFFFGEESDFVVHAPCLGALQRDDHGDGLGRQDITESNPDFFGLGMRTGGKRDQHCSADEPGDQTFDPRE